jgi:hypothetical protein
LPVAASNWRTSVCAEVAAAGWMPEIGANRQLAQTMAAHMAKREIMLDGIEAAPKSGFRYPDFSQIDQM